MKGNEAACHGAIAGGCRYFFGYPITPQNQIPEYMALHLPEVGGVYLQAESELAAINMVYGAAATGVRVMTSSSSPGVALMQEGLSYMIGSELPCVVINVCRGGPGLGNIAAAQSDYFMATRGAGHGDGSGLVFAPYSVQEMHDLTAQAFAVAEKYRTPVTVLADGILGQMAEPCRLQPWGEAPDQQFDWAIGGHRHGRERRVVNSLFVDPQGLDAHNQQIFARYQQAVAEVTSWQEYGHEEPDLLLCAYGICGRVAETVVDWAAAQGLKLRLLRPVSLLPFPSAPLRSWAERVRGIMVVELSMGQFVQDVRLAVEGRCPVHLQQRTGGVLLTPEDVLAEVGRVMR
jgi:2-oxoglutarate/2-oxoacid ferredoxin oxidoreductase subunit alpha